MDPAKVQIEPSWRSVLEESFNSDYFDQIVLFLKTEKRNGKVIYPPGSLIFNAFNTTKFDDLKVVILGQDPYHGPGQAMGLSFSVPRNIAIPASLKKIYKELYEDLGINPAMHGDLTKWAEQGVFLLNAMLTVEHRQPGSHKKIGWQAFTDAVIQTISDKKEGVVFLLWGNFARSKRKLINTEKHYILEAAHPSPLAGNAFLGCKHFSKTNQILDRLNKGPIDWDLN